MIGFDLTDEQNAIWDAAKTFSKKEVIPVAAEYDRTMEYPWDVVKKAHAQGLLNPSIPQSAGGLGLSTLEQALISEAIAYGCTGISTVCLGNDLALAPLLLAGTKEQIAELATPMTEQPLMAAY